MELVMLNVNVDVMGKVTAGYALPSLWSDRILLYNFRVVPWHNSVRPRATSPPPTLPCGTPVRCPGGYGTMYSSGGKFAVVLLTSGTLVSYAPGDVECRADLEAVLAGRCAMLGDFLVPWDSPEVSEEVVPADYERCPPFEDGDDDSFPPYEAASPMEVVDSPLDFPVEDVDPPLDLTLEKIASILSGDSPHAVSQQGASTLRKCPAAAKDELQTTQCRLAKRREDVEKVDFPWKSFIQTSNQYAVTVSYEDLPLQLRKLLESYAVRTTKGKYAYISGNDTLGYEMQRSYLGQLRYFGRVRDMRLATLIIAAVDVDPRLQTLRGSAMGWLHWIASDEQNYTRWYDDVKSYLPTMKRSLVVHGRGRPVRARHDEQQWSKVRACFDECIVPFGCMKCADTRCNEDICKEYGLESIVGTGKGVNPLKNRACCIFGHAVTKVQLIRRLRDAGIEEGDNKLAEYATRYMTKCIKTYPLGRVKKDAKQSHRVKLYGFTRDLRAIAVGANGTPDGNYRHHDVYMGYVFRTPQQITVVPSDGALQQTGPSQ